MSEEKKIRVCSKHSSYKTPLIFTFAFDGSEYWCPHCGLHGGMFGTGDMVNSTARLRNRLKRFTKFTYEYLHAKAVQICCSTEWAGEQIKPSDLPREEKDRLLTVIKEWKTGVKL